MKKTKLLICTPTIDNTVCTGYLNTIISMNGLLPEIETSVLTLSGNSVITDARNRLITVFIDSNNFDYMLFLDSDVATDAKYIKEMIDLNLDLVALPILKKNFQQLRVNMGNITKTINKSLVQVDGVATAIMLISKKLGKLIGKSVSTYSEGVEDTINASSLDIPKKVYDVFKVYNENGKYWNEDYEFCRFCIEKLNVPVHAKLDVVTQHFSGMVPFTYDKRNG